MKDWLQIEIADRRYRIDISSPIAEGEIAAVYAGDHLIGNRVNKQVAVKIVRDSQDNDLASNEVVALQILHQTEEAQRKHLPVVMDTFQTEDNQTGVIMPYLSECYDLDAVRERYPEGIDRKHMVWILNRTLSAIGYCHSRGILHGNIEPSHLMIRPQDHNAFIIDWTSAVIDPEKTGDAFKIFNEEFSPPEVAEKRTPLPSCDIYSIGLCMIDLLGGDIKARTVPEGVEEELARFLEVMTMISPLQRPQDAWQLHAQLNNLVVRLWGPKRFLRFDM